MNIIKAWKEKKKKRKEQKELIERILIEQLIKRAKEENKKERE